MSSTAEPGAWLYVDRDAIIVSQLELALLETKMTAINCFNSAELKPPIGHYSHVSIAGGMVFIAGQLPVDASGNPLAARPFADQARQVLANIDACLRAAGVDRSRLVQVRVFVTDIGQWPLFNQVYADWIGDHRPARAVAGASELHYGSAVEVEAIALTADGVAPSVKMVATTAPFG